jgi:hypothetical protein
MKHHTPMTSTSASISIELTLRKESPLGIMRDDTRALKNIGQIAVADVVAVGLVLLFMRSSVLIPAKLTSAITFIKCLPIFLLCVEYSPVSASSSWKAKLQNEKLSLT